MSIKTVRGIVLKEMPSGENSKHIVILAKGEGKLLLLARGARNPKSKFLAGTQLFSYCDFHLYEKRGFHAITQIDKLQTFYPLREDLEKLSQAMYVAELTEQNSMPGMENDELLELLIRTYLMLVKTHIKPKLAVNIFELKLLQISGFMPEMENCVICKKQLLHLVSFAINIGGFVCDEHKNKNMINVSQGAVRAMQFVFSHEGKSIFGFSLSDEVLNELGELIGLYMQVHNGYIKKSRNFSKFLELDT